MALMLGGVLHFTCVSTVFLDMGRTTQAFGANRTKKRPETSLIGSTTFGCFGWKKDVLMSSNGGSCSGKLSST